MKRQLFYFIACWIILIGMCFFEAARRYWHDLVNLDPVALIGTGIVVSVPFLVILAGAVLAYLERRRTHSRRDECDADVEETEVPSSDAIQTTQPIVPRGKKTCPRCRELLTVYAVTCRRCGLDLE